MIPGYGSRGKWPGTIATLLVDRRHLGHRSPLRPKFISDIATRNFTAVQFPSLACWRPPTSQVTVDVHWGDGATRSE